MKSKIKWAALGGLVLSFMSLLVHLFLAKSSANLVQYSAITAFSKDLQYANSAGRKSAGSRKLWGKVKALESLQPYARLRSSFPGNLCKSLFICLGLTTLSTIILNDINSQDPYVCVCVCVCVCTLCILALLFAFHVYICTYDDCITLALCV